MDNNVERLIAEVTSCASAFINEGKAYVSFDHDKIRQALTQQQTVGNGNQHYMNGYEEGVRDTKKHLQQTASDAWRDIANASSNTNPTYISCTSGLYTAQDAWLPIETAPRDGTEYLAINERGHYAVCHWDTMEWVIGNKQLPCVFPLTDATHWQPLPPTPTQRTESEE